MKDLVKFQKPELPEKWDYDESVKKVKPIIYKWNHLTADILSELWIARGKLAIRTGRPPKVGKKFPTYSWEGYCKDIGISKRIANIWLKIFELGWEAVLLSGSKEWFTPKEYIESIRQVLGEIDLNPASCKQANQTIKAKKFYSMEDDGLSHLWHGKVFLNPPYGNDGPPFVEKLIEEIKAGNVTEAILLVNSRATDAEWFQPLYDGIICFTDHRIDFDSPIEKNTSSTHGSCFIYFGQNERKFAQSFIEHGTILKRFNG